MKAIPAWIVVTADVLIAMYYFALLIWWQVKYERRKNQ